MTTKVTITNAEPTGSDHELVVNVCGADSVEGELKDKIQTRERHELKAGESVTVAVYGWRQFVQVLEMASREDARHASKQEE